MTETYRVESADCVWSEVTGKYGDSVEVFATVPSSNAPYFHVRFDCRQGESGSVKFDNYDAFKQFVDEVNWVFERAQVMTVPSK